MRKSVPQELHPLIPLLYGEDLLNFLSLLLGAVLKRASLALKRQRGAAAAPAPDEPPPEAPAEPKAPGELDTGELDKAELEALAKERASEERDTAEFEVPAELLGAPVPPGEAEPEVPAVETPETEVPAPPEAALPEPALPEIDDLPGIDAPLPPKPEPIIDTSLLAEALEELDFELPGVGLPDLPGTDLPAAGLPEPEPEPTAVDSGGPAHRRPDPLELEKRAALAELYDLLETLLSRANAHRKSFELVHRLLKQRKTVPPAMLQSMHPYLFDIMNSLIPQLHDLDHLTDISANHAANLFEYCTFLCDRNLTPEQIRGDVPRTMDRVLRLLDGLHGTASKLVADAPR